MTRDLILAAAAALALCAAAPAQTLTLDGAFVKAGPIDGTAIAALPRATLSVVEEHGPGTPVSYTGVTLASLLASRGVPVAKAAKGPAARSYVLVHAADGYVAIFTVSELQRPGSAACAPILTATRNGLAIAAPVGPFRLIAPCDGTQARWVHEVTGFTVVTVPDEKK